VKEFENPPPITVAIGLGRSGVAAARYLNDQGEKVQIFESSKKASFGKLSGNLEKEGIKVNLGVPLNFSSFQPILEKLALVIVSPGIPWDHPTLNQLRKRGIIVESEINLAWRALKNTPWVGITGTNGKTTVTHMLNHVLNNSFIESTIGGNVGKAATEIALALRKSTKHKPKWLIMELSSYQIETAPEISPEIGIWTTLTPDHLERHGSLENYFAIKRTLIANSSIRIYNADDKYLSKNRLNLPKGLWVSAQKYNSNINQLDFWISSNGMVIEQGNELFHSSALQLPGDHNLQNLLLVSAAARKIGLSGMAIENALISFAGITHRLEKVDKIIDIDIFNDSKATNFDSAEIGLKATSAPVILIAGGLSKQGIYLDWINQIKEKVCAVILIGESRVKLQHLIKSHGFRGEIVCYEKLDKAVDKAIKLGVKFRAKSILFSPGCASFDQYSNFEERGDHFKKLIKESSINYKL